MNWTLIIPAIPGVASLVGAWVLLKKSKPESKVLKANAEAAIIDAATKFGVATGEDLNKLRQDFYNLEERYRKLGEVIEQHREWDREVVIVAREQNIILPPPPPLHVPRMA